MLSAKQFNSFVKSSPNPTLLLKVDNYNFFVAGVNDLFTQTVNIPEVYLVGQDLLNAIQNNNVKFYGKGELLKFSLQQILATKENYQSEIYLFSSGYWRIENTPLFNDDGEVEYIAHYLIKKGSNDLFSRKSEAYSYEELLEIKEHYKILFEHDPDGLCSFDLEGKFLTANESFLKIAECKFEDIYNTSFAPLIAPEDLEMVLDHFQKCIKGDVQHYTMRGLTAKGNGTIANITNIPIKNNNKIIGVYAIVKNITEKFKAEEELKSLNAQLKTAHKISKIAYLHQDLPDGEIYWSEEVFDLFGLKNNEVVPGGEEFMKFVHPEDKDRIEAEMNRFYEEPKAIENQFRIVQKNGTTIKDVIFRSALVKDFYGNPTRLEGTFQDISEQKENQVLLKKLNEQLNKKARELSRVNTELEQFAYIASHDLKEPLRMITGFLQLLEKKYSDSFDETANKYINFALDGSKRMQQLITDLLQYSQITKEDIERKPVDLNAVYEEVRLNLIKQIEDNNATIVTNTLPTLKVNRSAILRLFQNLITNAIKFRKPDVAPEVIISAEEEKTHWVFSISDNGIGILEKDYDEIFEIFSRLNSKTEYPGSGIGLAKCKKIIQHHNGDIWVESKPGKGSAFYFTLEKN